MRAVLAMTLFAMTAGGCALTPLATLPTNNPTVNVELLFEHDDCRVYRFLDGNHYGVYSDCRHAPFIAQ